MSPSSVCLVAGTLPDEPCGIGAYVDRLATALSTRCPSVSVVTRASELIRADRPYNVIQLDTSWRLAEYLTVAATGLALGLIVLGYREAPADHATSAGTEPARFHLSVPGQVWALSISAGVGWALLNASVIVVASFAPSFLMTRGASVGEAGGITGVALWISILSVPLGGLVADRLKRPRLLMMVGCIATAITIACAARAPWPAFWLVASGILLGLPVIATPVLWLGGLFAFLAQGITPLQQLHVLAAVFYPVVYVVGFVVSRDPARRQDYRKATGVMSKVLIYLVAVIVLWPVIGFR